MNLPNRIYFTGVPGSRWSGVAQLIESCPGFNTTDRTPERDYTHHQFSGHKGAYFGEEMEFAAEPENVPLAYTDPSAGCMLAKSHDWSYNLEKLYKTAKEAGDWIVLVYRGDLISFCWWHQAGGFKISYPSYSWYQNSSRMLREICRQNCHILSFTIDHDLKWELLNPQWLEKNLGCKVNKVGEQFSDVHVTIIK